MNEAQQELWDRISGFSLDNDNETLTFLARLALENAWQLDFCRRVIQEYKRFTFLAIVAGHPVTPSDHVDQAWRLHLTYSRSNWNEFCETILQSPLHHEPTKGGTKKSEELKNRYQETVNSYTVFLVVFQRYVANIVAAVSLLLALLTLLFAFLARDICPSCKSLSAFTKTGKAQTSGWFRTEQEEEKCSFCDYKKWVDKPSQHGGGGGG